VPVRDVPAGVLATPFRDHVPDVRVRAPTMNDNPAASIARWLAAEIMPASATIVTSVRRRAVMNAPITGSIVLVSALSPSNAWTISGNPAASVSRPIVICGSSRCS
jgi:hypothetical protein